MPPVRRMTMEEVAAWLDRARALDLQRREAAPPAPVTSDRDVRVAKVQPGEQVTLADRPYDVLTVQSVALVDEAGDLYQLRVTSPKLQEYEDLTLPGSTVVVVHDSAPEKPDDGYDDPVGPRGIPEMYLRVIACGGSVEEARAAGDAQIARQRGLAAPANGGIIGPEPDTERDAAVVTVLGPPPIVNRTPYPYQGTIDFQGLPILVENPRGTERRGVGPDGKPWAITMLAHYGEIANTVGADNDPVDVYVGQDATAPDVWVMQTKVPGTNEFDEVKAFLGFRTRDEAVKMFRAHYDRPGFLFGIVKWSIADFKAAMVLRSTSSGRLDAPGANA